MQDIPLPGHGAKERPQELKVKDHVYGVTPPYDWSTVKEDTVGNVPGVYGIADQEQGTGGTCTCQTKRYGFKYTIGLDGSIEEDYSHVVLPGGGAYLNAVLDYARNNGVAPQSKYPDPYPQTEANMSKVIKVKDGDRIRTFQLTYTFYPDVTNIDSAAFAASQHSYIHLGIRGSWTDGWDKTWTDPKAPAKLNTNYWQHALFAAKEGIVLRNGFAAIKAKSSWNEHKDFQGNPSHCHYLNRNYFVDGGVFEIIGVDLKEITSMPQVATQQKGAELRLVLKCANITEFNSLCAVLGKDSTQIEEHVVDSK